jgi:hypothetical protein
MNDNFVCSLRNWRELPRGGVRDREGWTSHVRPMLPGPMVDVGHSSIQSPERYSLSVK